MTADLAQLADRRAGLAALLGLLLLEEPGPGLADLVANVPDLAPLASGAPGIAAEYERCFLRGVSLYESVFLGDDGQCGGPVVSDVVESYARHGFTEHRDGRWRVAGADHLGLELRCYAALCREEAQAWRSDVTDAAMKAVEAERVFLAEHIARWAELALLACAQRAGEGPYGRVIEAVLAFLREEHDRLRPAPTLSMLTPVDPVEPVDPVDALSHSAPSLSATAAADLPTNLGPARLARLLLAPQSCGTWLPNEAIESAARSIGVPWRPSDTRSALRHVIESAHDDGHLPQVLSMLAGVVEHDATACAARAEAEPGNGETWRGWARRGDAMANLLRAIIADGRLGRAERPASETLIVSGSVDADGALLADTIDRVVVELRAAGLHVERSASPPG